MVGSDDISFESGPHSDILIFGGVPPQGSLNYTFGVIWKDQTNWNLY